MVRSGSSSSKLRTQSASFPFAEETMESTTPPDGKGLLLGSLMPMGMDSSNRNDWLVDIPLPGQGVFPPTSDKWKTIQKSITSIGFT